MIAAALLAAGCASHPGPAVAPRIDGYALAGVEVTVDGEAWTGWFERVDNVDNAEFASEVEEKLEAALTEATTPSFTGDHPAMLLVHVDEMNIASGLGRALMGRQSRIGGMVSVVDAATDETVVRARLSELEKDVRFGGNVGRLVEVAKNVTDAAVNDRVEKVAREFAQRVHRWLESGRAEGGPAARDAAATATVQP